MFPRIKERNDKPWGRNDNIRPRKLKNLGAFLKFAFLAMNLDEILNSSNKDGKSSSAASNQDQH